jgi:hypothetical protein
MDVEADVARLFFRIQDLELEIAAWRSKNSQSNPGAMFELRRMRKELDTLTAQFKKLTEPPKNPAKDREPHHETRDS